MVPLQCFEPYVCMVHGSKKKPVLTGKIFLPYTRMGLQGLFSLKLLIILPI
jgi:hypothetical protein